MQGDLDRVRGMRGRRRVITFISLGSPTADSARRVGRAGGCTCGCSEQALRGGSGIYRHSMSTARVDTGPHVRSERVSRRSRIGFGWWVYALTEVGRPTRCLGGWRTRQRAAGNCWIRSEGAESWTGARYDGGPGVRWREMGAEVERGCRHADDAGERGDWAGLVGRQLRVRLSSCLCAESSSS